MAWNPADFDSLVWKKLAAHMDAEVSRLRTENDNPLKDDVQTALIRGEIKALKRLLALPSQAALAPTGEPIRYD